MNNENLPNEINLSLRFSILHSEPALVICQNLDLNLDVAISISPLKTMWITALLSYDISNLNFAEQRKSNSFRVRQNPLYKR